MECENYQIFSYKLKKASMLYEFFEITATAIEGQKILVLVTSSKRVLAFWSKLIQIVGKVYMKDLVKKLKK